MSGKVPEAFANSRKLVGHGDTTECANP